MKNTIVINRGNLNGAINLGFSLYLGKNFCRLMVPLLNMSAICKVKYYELFKTHAWHDKKEIFYKKETNDAMAYQQLQFGRLSHIIIMCNHHIN